MRGGFRQNRYNRGGGGPENRRGRGGRGGHGYDGERSISPNQEHEVSSLRREVRDLRHYVDDLFRRNESMSNSIFRLRLENEATKRNVKRLVAKTAPAPTNPDAPEIDYDYSQINDDYILVGGLLDPFFLRYEIPVVLDGITFKSAERLYWYKMAAEFGDDEAKEKIVNAPTFSDAEDAARKIKGFKQAVWDTVKLNHWAEVQKEKFAQHRHLSNLLVYSKHTYIAVSHADRFFGTGWRKNRPESAIPDVWDGENEGGKVLMKLRAELTKDYKLEGDELAETQRKYDELFRTVWRRLDIRGSSGFRRGGGFGGGRRGRGGRPRGGRQQQHTANSSDAAFANGGGGDAAPAGEASDAQ